jgi:hypothetical protein
MDFIKLLKGARLLLCYDTTKDTNTTATTTTNATPLCQQWPIIFPFFLVSPCCPFHSLGLFLCMPSFAANNAAQRKSPIKCH